MKYIEYKENKRHGADDFPIEYYYVNKDHLQYVMPLHWHGEFEIVRILSGTLELYINNVKHTIFEGDIAFINCGDLHRADPQDAVYECLVFSTDILSTKKNRVYDKYVSALSLKDVSAKPVLHKENSALYSSVCELMSAHVENTPHRELKISYLIYKFIYFLFEENMIENKTDRDTHASQSAKTISKLIDWIDIHYSERITLGILSEKSGFSEKYLCRVFRAYTSYSPIDYINILRINKVCRDLESGKYTVTEAAFNNGFNNLSYFSKTFKKYKSVTPSSYIKQSRGAR
ncbi:MAG: helix-turn-helix domain-containing protein [Ruminococcaceae bacterium]|nr:helix-turn-helix domain-containing protein [Oscillospiraceae bacterium]